MNLIYRSFIYDFCYMTGDILVKTYPVCNIHTESNRVVCNSSYCAGLFTGNKSNLCCDGCIHLSKGGCTVRCLSCKIGFCFEGYAGPGLPYFGKQQLYSRGFRTYKRYIPFIENYKYIEPHLKIIWNTSYKLRLLSVRKSKAVLFSNLRNHKII